MPTIRELRAFAKREGIELGRAKLKRDIEAIVAKAEQERAKGQAPVPPPAAAPKVKAKTKAKAKEGPTAASLSLTQLQKVGQSLGLHTRDVLTEAIRTEVQSKPIRALADQIRTSGVPRLEELQKELPLPPPAIRPTAPESLAVFYKAVFKSLPSQEGKEEKKAKEAQEAKETKEEGLGKGKGKGKPVGVAWQPIRDIRWLHGVLQVVLLRKGNQVFLLLNDGAHDRQCLPKEALCSAELKRTLGVDIKRDFYPVGYLVRDLLRAMSTSKLDLPQQRCLDVFLELPYQAQSVNTICPHSDSTINKAYYDIFGLRAQFPSLRVHTTDFRRLGATRGGFPVDLYEVLEQIVGELWTGPVGVPTPQQFQDFYRRQLQRLEAAFPKGVTQTLFDQVIRDSQWMKLKKQGVVGRNLPLTETKELLQKIVLDRPILERAAREAHTAGSPTPWHKLLRERIRISATARPRLRYVAEPVWIIRQLLPWVTRADTRDILDRWLTEFMVEVGTFFVDLYGFARAMKRFDVTLPGAARRCQDSPMVSFGIYYAGDAHIDRWQKWLRLAGFELVMEVHDKATFESHELADRTRTEGRCLLVGPLMQELARICSQGSACYGER